MSSFCVHLRIVFSHPKEETLSAVRLQASEENVWQAIREYWQAEVL